jgi:hypothetical protein
MSELKSETTWLKSLDTASNGLCVKENRPIILGLSDKLGAAMAARPVCKCWNCPACAARNAKKWIARIIHGCNHLDTVNGWHMFTLTAHRKWRKKSSVVNLRQGWKKLYNCMRREFGTNHFCKVWEMHADGSYHLHGLIDCVIPARWLKDKAVQCGMGYQVEIHAVDNAGQVAGYIAKYFLKSESNVKESEDWYPNLRRIEVSRSWLKLPDLKDDNWSWMIAESGNFADIWINRKKHQGYEIIDKRGETKVIYFHAD